MNQNAFLAICCLMMLAACATTPTTEELVRQNAEAYFLEKMNDPASYEFVKLELRDSFLISDHVSWRRDGFLISLKSDRQALERQLRYESELPSLYEPEKVEKLQANIARMEAVVAGIDSIAAGIDTTAVESYLYTFSFRANNAMGAKILNEYILQVGVAPNYEVFHAGESVTDVVFRPTALPGYLELIEQD
jgi:hypothetical protein